MNVSVVISTYSPDRLGDLLGLLGSLKNQTYKDFETIVVIDRDLECYNVVKNNAGHNVKVFFNETNRGLAYSRNLGLKKATGEIIAFIDDDAIPNPDWIEEHVKVYREDKNIGGVAGEVTPLWESDSMRWFPRELWWIISCSHTMMPTKKQEVRNGFGTNMSFRRQVLDEVGFFNTKLGKKGEKWILSEEVELCIRIRRNAGRKLMYNPKAGVKHKIYSCRLKMRNILKRAFYDGYSKAFLSSAYGANVLATELRFLREILFPFYSRSLRRVASEPFQIFRKLLVFTLAVMAEGAGYLHYKLTST